MARTFVLAGLLLCMALDAHAAQRKIKGTKHGHWPLTAIEFLDPETGAECYSFRYTWPERINDAYSFYDASGKSQATATFASDTLSAWTFAGARIALADSDGRPLGRVEGQWLTWHRARFILSGADDLPIALAYVDYAGSDVVIVDINNPGNVLATLGHVTPLQGMEPPYWNIWVDDAKALPWVLTKAFATYVIDFRDWINFYGWTKLFSPGTMAGRAGNTLSEVVPLSASTVVAP